MTQPFRFILVLVIVWISVTNSTAVEIVTSSIGKDIAWVGEAVPFRVDLYSPGPFSGTAKFELPDLNRGLILKTGRPVVGSKEVDGETCFTQSHDFVVYTQESGTIIVPSFEVGFFGKKDFTSVAVSMTGRTQELRFESKRPPGFGGQAIVLSVPDLEVGQSWDPEPGNDFHPGDVLVRKVTRTAIGMTSMMLSPLVIDAPESIKLYQGNPRVDDQTERGESVATRVDSFKYQFTQPGSFEIPSIRVVWWDPKQEKMVERTLDGISVNVLSIEALNDQQQAEFSEPLHWSSVLFLVASALGTTSLLILFLYIWRPFEVDSESIDARAVLAGCQLNDAVKTYQAFRRWEEKFSQLALSDEGLDQCWAELNAYLFGRQMRNDWDGHRFQKTFQRHRSKALKAKTLVDQSDGLPTLNPGRLREAVSQVQVA